MANQNIRSGDGAGAGMGFRGGKGKPGYPLPDDMLNRMEPQPSDQLETGVDDPDTRAGVLETAVDSIIAQMSSPGGLVEDGEPPDVVKRSTPLDLVVWNAINGMLGEAEEPGDLPKGIDHLEDLKPEQFLQFLSKYKDLPLKGGLEVSEKVDGSARISFGIHDGKIWTQSKNGQKKMSADQYGDQPMYKALKACHQALASKENEIAAAWPNGVEFMVAEALYTRIPNSIEYGPNVVLIHGVHGIPSTHAEEAAKQVIKAAKGMLSGNGEDWKFEFKRVVQPEDVMVDTQAEYDSLGEIYQELKKLQPDKLKAAGKAPYKAALEKFQAIQKALKKKLVGQLRKQRSAYGPEGGDVEGLVFKDLETGGMTKLVDKEYFTKLNKFLWQYREMLDRGVKIGDQWHVGILQKFRNRIADNVMGSPAAKSPGFVQTLKKFGAGLEYPPGADSPEKKVDFLLAQYIKQNDLMKGDFVTGFKKELIETKAEFEKLKVEWDSKKKGDITHQVKDDDGKVIKTVKMDPIIKGRTDDAFKHMEDFFAGIGGAVEYAQKMQGDLTKRTALLKVLLGQNRLEKLQGASAEAPQEEDVNIKLMEAPAAPTSFRDPEEVLKFFGEKLKGRKIDTSHAKELGSGHNGTAYDLGGGKVLKITQDPYEAKASLHLQGKKLKHVAQIYDVFKFPAKQVLKGRGPMPWYGIFQEKVTPMSGVDQTEFEHARLFVTRHFADLKNFKTVDNMWSVPWEQIRGRVMANSEEMEEVPEAKEALGTLERIGLPDVLDELKKNQVEYKDIHVGNFMRRGKDLVVIDLGGASKSPGGEPPVLERVIEGVLDSLSEAKADQVGVTIGRFQPFHKGHAQMIRDLAHKFTKVLVIVAGNSKDKKNPFSYDLRLKMMQKSLPDVMSKLEVRKAVMGGKNSGYLPGVLSDIVKDGGSSLDADTAVQILVGQDRLPEIQKQLEHSKQAKANGTVMMFDPDLATVGSIPDVKNDDDVDRISGTRVRDAIVQDKKEVVKSMMDSHLVSNPADFEGIYAELKRELGTQPTAKPQKVAARPSPVEIVEQVLDEVISDIGGEPGVKEILQVNRDLLANSRWHINVDQLHRLGGGQEGIAFDAGHDKVLKVTADVKEAKTSFGLIGKTNLKHVVHVFDVFSFPNLAKDAPARANTISAGPAQHPAYGVVTEKLTPLSAAEIKEFDDMTDHIQTQMGKQNYLDAIWTSDWPGFIKKMQETFEEDIAKEGGLTPESPRFQRVLQGRMTQYTTFFAKYKVPEMMKELHSLGIKFADYHGGNMMKRGSEYVINDLGRSESPSKIEPPKLGEPSKMGQAAEQVVVEQILKEFDMNTNGTGLRAGSSAVSSFKNPADPNVADLWQTQLDRLQIHGSGALPEQGELVSGRSARYAPIVLDQWNKWAPNAATMYDEPAHSLSGRGELSFQIELENRGIAAENVGETCSYDVRGDKKYEVKELTGMRIEKTGIPAAKEAMEFLGTVVKALSNSVREIEEEIGSDSDWLEPHGVSIPQLKAFLTTVDSSLRGTGVPMGLMALTTKKGSVLPVNFKTVMEAIDRLLKTSEDKRRRRSVPYSRNENSESFLNQEIEDSSARVIAKAIAREIGIRVERALEVSEPIIVLSNFKEQGIRPADMSYESIRNRFLQTFDPSKIMGETEIVVVVHKDKGFFPFEKSKMPEYLNPAGISKGVPRFTPNQKLRGKTERKKKDPFTPTRVRIKKIPGVPFVEPVQGELPL